MANLETVNIPGVEVFSVGCWNKDSYSENDLLAMAEAFGKTGFQPTVKAGHAEGQEQEEQARKVFGSPALGYVERLYVRGKKLVADLIDVPRKFADLIKAGSFKRISAEVYWNFSDPNQGFTLPRVLKSVAFLGADIPSITNLDAVRALYSQRQNEMIIKICTLKVNEEESKMSFKDAVAELDYRAKMYQADHDVSYYSALRTVLDGDADLRRRYAFGEGRTGPDASAIVADRAANFAQQHSVTVAEAIRQVLSDDPELANSYLFNHLNELK